MATRTAPPSSLAPGLRDRKKAKQRAAILEAGIRLFRSHGYDGTTVDAIAREADISQPTFYNYFPSKDALLREFAVHGAGDALEALRRDPSADIEAKLRRYFRALAAFVTAERGLFHALAVSNVYNPVRDPEVLRSEGAGTRALEALIGDAQARGELGTRFSAVRLASLIEGMMLRACVEWAADFPEPHPLVESLEENLTFFFRGAGLGADTRAGSARHEG